MSSNVYSKSKTLVANWVEERQCAHLEKGNRTEDGKLDKKLHKTGHKGILSPSPSSPMSCTTMVQQSYQPPASIRGSTPRSVGKRQEQIVAQLYDMISSEVHEEFLPPPPKHDYKSITHNDFNKDFTPTVIPPTRSHNVYTESPATYWSDNIGNATGVSQVKVQSAPFHKNSAFSTPIEDYLDQPKPHGID
ncbi:sperm-associated antigen 8-like [Halichondria panicea]|uniref:sperm-associated antigen 8-like n=1 Tax=Halichondria panicea TaxID=6063 RepID=UPI00312BB168